MDDVTKPESLRIAYMLIEIDGQLFSITDSIPEVKAWFIRWIQRIKWNSATVFRVHQYRED